MGVYSVLGLRVSYVGYLQILAILSLATVLFVLLIGTRLPRILTGGRKVIAAIFEKGLPASRHGQVEVPGRDIYKEDQESCSVVRDCSWKGLDTCTPQSRQEQSGKQYLKRL